jgi:hypothetical protein
MPNRYQWIVFICTVVILLLEITADDFFAFNVFDFNIGRRGQFVPNIQAFLLFGLTAFVGFFLYRVAGKAKSKRLSE